MPTYEYLCKTCSHRFETWQKMTDDPLTVCPECGATIRRVLYPAGIVFKGSGFYKTDHPANSAPHDSQEAKTTSSETASASESKESKPAESGTNGTVPASTTTGDSSGGKAPASVA